MSRSLLKCHLWAMGNMLTSNARFSEQLDLTADTESNNDN